MGVDSGYEVIARYTSEREVRNAIETLTLQGIGATSEAGDEPDPEVGRVVFSLLVVPVDANRARAVLGLELDPAAEEEGSGRRFPDWAYALGIFLVALIVIPLVAFYVSFKLAGG